MNHVSVFILFGLACGALIYCHMVYPLLMALASRRKVIAPRIDEWPTVSLIIPAHDESAVIEEKLRNALAVDYPAGRLEVIVASDGSGDDTVRQARVFRSRGVEVLELYPQRGKASVLNDAVDVASGEVLCLCDANVMFRPDALRKMVAPLSDPLIGAVTGDVRLASEQADYGEGERLYYRLERAIQLGESRVGSVVCVDGGMYVVRRELFRRLPPDTVLDDLTTTIRVLRQGKRVVYEPAAIADENGTPDWCEEYRRRVRTMVGAVQSLKRGLCPPVTRPVVLWQYISHKLLRWLGPLWLGVVLLTSCLLWRTGPLMQTAVIAQGVFYSMAVLAAFSGPVRRTRLGGISFYFAMSHLAMAEGWLRGLIGNPSGVWQRTLRTPLPGRTASTSPAAAPSHSSALDRTAQPADSV